MTNLDFNFFCSDCPKSIKYREENCFLKYRVKSFKKGDYLAYKGEIAKELSIVTRGSVNTSIILDSGISFSTKFHSAPYPLGALALFAKKNHYRADFMALEDCDVISVSKEGIEDQMSRCRVFLRNFIAYNTSKIDVFASHLTVLTQKSLKAKLSFYILTSSRKGVFRFDKTIEELASYLCVERPSLSRVLSQFIKCGLISYNRGQGQIMDVGAMRAMLD